MKAVGFALLAVIVAGCLEPIAGEREVRAFVVLDGNEVTLDLRVGRATLRAGGTMLINATVTNHGPGTVYVSMGGCGIEYGVAYLDGRTRSRPVYVCTANVEWRALPPGETIDESWEWDGRTVGQDEDDARYVAGRYELSVTAHLAAERDGSDPAPLRADLEVRLL